MYPMSTVTGADLYGVCSAGCLTSTLSSGLCSQEAETLVQGYTVREVRSDSSPGLSVSKPRLAPHPEAGSCHSGSDQLTGCQCSQRQKNCMEQNLKLKADPHWW